MLLDEDEILKLIKSLQKDYKFLLVLIGIIELQIVCLTVIYLL